MEMLLNVGLPLALAFIMFSLGLGLTISDFGRVLRQPRAVLVGIVSQMILLPVCAAVLLMFFDLPAEVAVGVMILAACPGGVTSNMLTKFAGGSVALSVTLTGIMSLLAVVTVPLITTWSMDTHMGADAPPVNVTALALAMVGITTVPVTLGLVIRALVLALVARIERGISLLAALLFAVIILGALAANWGAFRDNIATLSPLLVVLNLLLLGIGLTLARSLRLPVAEAKAVALEAGIQNGTLGIAVGALLAGGALGENAFALPSGIYGITMYLITLPIIAVLRRWGR
ncbi:MAG: bile acid:sodium symporter family protein [Pseudomonadota bacterium]